MQRKEFIKKSGTLPGFASVQSLEMGFAKSPPVKKTET